MTSPENDIIRASHAVYTRSYISIRLLLCAVLAGDRSIVNVYQYRPDATVSARNEARPHGGYGEKSVGNGRPCLRRDRTAPINQTSLLTIIVRRLRVYVGSADASTSVPASVFRIRPTDISFRTVSSRTSPTGGPRTRFICVHYYYTEFFFLII